MTAVGLELGAVTAAPERFGPGGAVLSIGGLLGGLGKKVAPKPSEPDTSKPGTLMSTTNELLSVSTTVSSADVSIPAGFKEKK